MGGNDGDCADYRGRVGSVAVTGSTPAFFPLTRARRHPRRRVDGRSGSGHQLAGDVWVSAGNGSVHTDSKPYDDSDSALELTPAMQLIQYFAPASWAQDNASDYDMSTAPVLLASGQVVLAGKSPRVYLLNGAHLGGIGHPETP